MAKAGADYGMSLLWTIFISCAITYFLIQLFGKFTLVTGLTALQSFRQHIHPGVSIFFIVALTAQICGSVIGVMGILADVCYEWSKTFIEGGISQLYFALFFSLKIQVRNLFDVDIDALFESFERILRRFANFLHLR